MYNYITTLYTGMWSRTNIPYRKKKGDFAGIITTKKI